MDSEFISAFLKKNDLHTIHEEKPKIWWNVNPFNCKPVQVADIRPYTHEEKEETPLVEFKMPELHGKLVEGINREFDKFLKNKRLRQHADLMDTVLYAKFATDKVAEDEMEKKCINCRYHHEWCCDINRPCRNCDIDYNKWEPKEENKMGNFAKEKRLSCKFYHSYENNYLSMTFWEGGVTKGYRVYGDGCDPAKEISRIVESLTNAFKLKSSTVYGDLPSIKNVIFNDPATIVFWVDGTKTVVKAQDEAYDPEKGMAMAIAKKALGNQGNYCNVFKKWLPEEVEIEFNGFDMVSFNEAVEAVKKMSEKLKAMKDKELEEAEEKVKELTFTDAMAAISEFAKHFNLGEVDFRLVPKEEENEITDKSI